MGGGARACVYTYALPTFLSVAFQPKATWEGKALSGLHPPGHSLP